MAKCELCDSPDGEVCNMCDQEGGEAVLCWTCCRSPSADASIRARRAKAEPNDTIPAPPPAPDADERPPWMLCESCQAPKREANKRFCAYCANRSGPVDEATKAQHTAAFSVSADARARMAKADARAAHRPTATEKMLALPHPWECDEGAP